MIGFNENLQNVTINKDYAFTVLHTSQIAVTTAHTKSQFVMSSPVVTW
jgi:hypothetical protein